MSIFFLTLTTTTEAVAYVRCDSILAVEDGPDGSGAQITLPSGFVLVKETANDIMRLAGEASAVGATPFVLVAA